MTDLSFQLPKMTKLQKSVVSMTGRKLKKHAKKTGIPYEGINVDYHLSDAEIKSRGIGLSISYYEFNTWALTASEYHR